MVPNNLKHLKIYDDRTLDAGVSVTGTVPSPGLLGYIRKQPRKQKRKQQKTKKPGDITTRLWTG